MSDHAIERAELLARIRGLRGELAQISERIATANAQFDVRELRARAEQVEAEIGGLIKLLDWPTG